MMKKKDLPEMKFAGVAQTEAVSGGNNEEVVAIGINPDKPEQVIYMSQETLAAIVENGLTINPPQIESAATFAEEALKPLPA
ncbi:MAG: hypothetical protein DHS20C02_14600 [Micavibrio sp.]|nr:MAG: hypothetical protein DHS20C02_14600 [Micavibrio sp.]